MHTKSGMKLPMACCLRKVTPSWSLQIFDQSLRSAGVGFLRSLPALCMVLGLDRFLRGIGDSHLPHPYPPQMRQQARRIWGGLLITVWVEEIVFISKIYSHVAYCAQTPPNPTALSSYLGEMSEGQRGLRLEPPHPYPTTHSLRSGTMSPNATTTTSNLERGS
jgi:hypothetical protein